MKLFSLQVQRCLIFTNLKFVGQIAPLEDRPLPTDQTLNLSSNKAGDKGLVVFSF